MSAGVSVYLLFLSESPITNRMANQKTCVEYVAEASGSGRPVRRRCMVKELTRTE